MGSAQSVEPYTKEERFRNTILRVEMFSIEHHIRVAVDKIIADGKIPKIKVVLNNKLADTEIYIKIL